MPIIAALALVAVLFPVAESVPPAPVYDVILRGGRIVDGTGSPWFESDLAIRGDRIDWTDLRGYFHRLATFEEPHRFSEGIAHVFVNGEPVIESGAVTGKLPGRALKGPGFVRP